MIIHEIFIEDLNLKYNIGINQINFDYNEFFELNNLLDENDALKYLFSLISQLNEKYKEAVIQFFNDEYLLNEDHIIKASYFIQKAFLNKVNISNNKSLELLLYLSTQRQIKRSIQSFGVKFSNLLLGNLNYCIISPKANISEINHEIINRLKARDLEITINNVSLEKLDKIKSYYDISDNQINSIINSYGEKEINTDDENTDSIIQALHDLICEKMSILSLEKIKSD
jgi:hypothetical protein